MSPVPPPAASPQVPRDEPDEQEPITGSHFIPATQADLKKTAKIITTADVRWFLGTIAVIIAGTAATIAWGADAMDKKIEPVERRVERLELGAQAQAIETARTTTMLEMLVRDRGMTPPPKPPATDGGP